MVANIHKQASLLLDKQLSFQRTPSKNYGGGHDDRSHINSSELQVSRYVAHRLGITVMKFISRYFMLSRWILGARRVALIVTWRVRGA